MALFKKKKKDEEPDAGFEEGLGMTGALAESKKGGLFGRKKDEKNIEEPSDVIEEDIPDSIECLICGTISPPGTPECETCGGALSEPHDPGEDVQPEDETVAEPEESLADEPGGESEREMPEQEPDILDVNLETAKDIEPEKEGTAPAWQPMSGKELKAAEKAIKKDVKILDKQLKKGQISQKEHDNKIKELRISHGLEPPEREVEPAPVVDAAAEPIPEVVVDEEQDFTPEESVEGADTVIQEDLTEEPEAVEKPTETEEGITEIHENGDLEELLVLEEEISKIDEPGWIPLTGHARDSAEKEFKKKMKPLDKQLKKGQISLRKFKEQELEIKINLGLVPPGTPVEISPEPVPPEQQTDAFQDDISEEQIELSTKVLDMETTEGELEEELDMEIDDILPPEILALEELVEFEEVISEPEPAPRPRPETVPEKTGFIASRKIFGDKKKQLEEWEESLRGEEYKIQQSKAALDNRERKLRDKDFEIQTELQIIQTKKEELSAKEKIISQRDVEIQELGARLAERDEELDNREAGISERESAINEMNETLDIREADIQQRIKAFEEKEKDIIARETETREKWLEMREFDRKLSTRSEELGEQEEELSQRRMDLRKRDSELDDKRRELDARNRELEARDRELTSIQEAIAKKEDELASKIEENNERSRQLEETSLEMDAKKEELETHETDLSEREERQEAWKKRLEAKENELAVKSNELSSKEGAIRTAERELDERKEKLTIHVKEIKSLEDQTLMRKREVDEVELMLIQKENDLFNREQGLSRKEAAR